MLYHSFQIQKGNRCRCVFLFITGYLMKSICNVKFVYSVSSSISLAFLTSSSTFNQIHGFIFIEMNYFAIQTIRSEVLNSLHFSPPFESGGTLKGACRTRPFLRQFRIASNAKWTRFSIFFQKSSRAFPNKIIFYLSRIVEICENFSGLRVNVYVITVFVFHISH